MGKLRLTKHFLRQRIRSPSSFKRASLRTVIEGKHRVIVGRLKGHVTTSVQAILHPKSEKHRRGCKTCARLKKE